ncbi:tellurium resistance protein [Actibacterium sp. MT2.3-13A]|uniref:SLAC1 family transporter n=1 Tax=Actibacterium sp. MT2.3-13A TaxID=2828332 RepID=UPI0020113F2A|nr:tellurium resistance protein [Actibacterium sp. MT2.3-13A]
MAQKLKFGQRTPPAIFPPVLGLLGLGLAWRRAEAVFVIPPAIADLLLGMVTLLLLWCLLAYGVKLTRRPGVFVEDLAALPGRAGLAAMMMAVMLLAAALLPHDTGLAGAALLAGLAGHGLLALIVAFRLLTGPAEQRQITPVWHLSFVGPILAPLSAVPLGYRAGSEALFWAMLALSAVIWAVSLGQLVRRDPPAPLRPLLAIHLSPASVLGLVALQLGWTGAAMGFAAFGGLILAALLLRARYVAAAGFSPLWGAFTFPLAAFANLTLALADGQGDLFRLAGAALLVAATGAIPAIAFKVMQGWAKGQLAAKTNAATA